MDYVRILKEELVMAMGCTEPACVALCAAGASELLGDALPVKAEISVSSYIAKNGMFVGIPGTDGLAGLPIAAALGIAGKNSAHGLDLLRFLSPDQKQEALKLLPDVHILVRRGTPKVFVEAALTSAEGETAYCMIAVGYNMMKDMRDGRLGADSANHIVALTAAAADARMAGCQHSVMSTAGSGNQGLTASVPIIAMAQRENREESELLRALALSELMTICAKRYIGRLSILCGCSIAAAVGVCAGLVMLEGGSREQMALAIKTLVADISGVICDGAKLGCALKIATATASALRAAALAMRGCGAGNQDGIVCTTVEDTLANLGLLGSLGMRETNQVVLDMMMQKANI